MGRVTNLLLEQKLIKACFPKTPTKVLYGEDHSVSTDTWSSLVTEYFELRIASCAAMEMPSHTPAEASSRSSSPDSTTLCGSQSSLDPCAELKHSRFDIDEPATQDNMLYLINAINRSENQVAQLKDENNILRQELREREAEAHLAAASYLSLVSENARLKTKIIVDKHVIRYSDKPDKEEKH